MRFRVQCRHAARLTGSAKQVAHAKGLLMELVDPRSAEVPIPPHSEAFMRWSLSEGHDDKQVQALRVMTRACNAAALQRGQRTVEALAKESELSLIHI